MNSRGMRKERQGVVLSNRMQKTVVVAVERTVRHAKYKDRKSTRLNSSHIQKSRMPSSA